jgi:alkyldihydroxyacetonephosphate synthase
MTDRRHLDTRRRKFWGWGFESEQLTQTEIDDLGAAMHQQLGGAVSELVSAPSLGELDLPTPRVRVPATLEGICGSTTWDRAEHAYGKGFRDYVRGLARRYDHAPDVVAFPTSEAELVSVLDWASGEDVAVIPYGGGSSVVGGVEPDVGDRYRGTVTVDMRHLNQVLEIDRESRAAVVQTGVLGPDLEAQLKPHGLSLRFFLQSFQFSTLGGWAATRAAGHYATLLTHIDESVQALRVVTPQGLVQTRRLPGDGAGVSPERMFLGSEGTLGILTEAAVRLQERPTFRVSASARFTDFDRAWHAVRTIAQSGLWPANCRLLDPVEAQMAGAADGTESVLVLAFESADHPVEESMRRAASICAGFGGILPPEALAGRSAPAANRQGAAGRWRDFFIRGPYLQEALVRMGVLWETFETACTWQAFPELHMTVTDVARRIVEQECGSGLVGCRFSHVYPDGVAPYYTVIAPFRRGAELQQWAAIKAKISDAFLSCGGTTTHHHAVGRTHRPWYDQQRPDLFAAALRAAKTALDPQWVMNPGVLVDPSP